MAALNMLTEHVVVAMRPYVQPVLVSPLPPRHPGYVRALTPLQCSPGFDAGPCAQRPIVHLHRRAAFQHMAVWARTHHQACGGNPRRAQLGVGLIFIRWRLDSPER